MSDMSRLVPAPSADIGASLMGQMTAAFQNLRADANVRKNPV
jgi:hypothetical protein